MSNVVALPLAIRLGPAREQPTPAKVLDHTYGPSRALDAMARDASAQAMRATTEAEWKHWLAQERHFDAQAAKARRLEGHRVALARGAADMLAYIERHPMRGEGA